MRFLGLELCQSVPDAKTIWLYRERLKKKGLMDRLFSLFGQMLREKGYLAMSGQIVDASFYDGHVLLPLLDKNNTSSSVWGDTAYRNQTNEKLLVENGFRSQLHRKKPKKKPMPLRTQCANGKKSKIRAHVEHVFAVQKERMRLFIRTIGLERARIKITLANLTYNLQRLSFWEKRAAPTG